MIVGRGRSTKKRTLQLEYSSFQKGHLFIRTPVSEQKCLFFFISPLSLFFKCIFSFYDCSISFGLVDML